MQFKHPEILYFLFLLVIPVLVHLFQLRRFQKEYFTNVRLLQQLLSQTRKSSEIKKWLLLLVRSLLLATIILAFAQPYFTDKNTVVTEDELHVVLDNSYSMQAQGKQGELFKRAIQDIMTWAPQNQNISIYTNNQSFKEVNVASIKNDLLKLDYTFHPFSMQQISHAMVNANDGIRKKVIIYTDGLGIDEKSIKTLPENLIPYWVVPQVTLTNNVSVDSVYIKPKTDLFDDLVIQLSCYGQLAANIPLSVLKQNQPIAKTTVSFTEPKKEVVVTIPKGAFQGIVVIEDKALLYDNQYYFSVAAPQTIKVMSIGALEKSAFLSRIYTSDQFKFTSVDLKDLNYNDIEKQELVVLNELKEIPIALQNTLEQFVQKGGSLTLIPAVDSDEKSMNLWLQKITGSRLTSENPVKKLITKIHATHPLFKGVFDQSIKHFDYPYSQAQYQVSGRFSSVLSYQDGNPFLASLGALNRRVYLFTTPIHEACNFKNSPLVVPVFYNMAVLQKQLGLSYVIGKNQTWTTDVAVQKDEVLSLVQGAEKIIPLQQINNNQVKLTFQEEPKTAGNFKVNQGDKTIGTLSFNYPRTESDIFKPIVWTENQTIFKNSEAVWDEVLTVSNDNWVWRWLVLLTLLLLITEILIQKLLK